MTPFRPTYVGEVKDSAELRRILSLPRRLEPPVGCEGLTEALRLPEGSMELRPVQAQALAELHLCGGLFAPIRVGGGKTLVSFLAPLMVCAERPVLLVPAKLRDKTLRDFDDLAKHWKRGPTITLVSYELLGRPAWAGLLNSIQPDLIECDEAHYLKNVKAAVTKRVGRYMDAHPDTTFAAMSGTMTKRSLFDFAHVLEWCLGPGAPVPLQWRNLDEWSRALDEDSVYPEWYRPGALRKLHGESITEWAAYVTSHQGNERHAARSLYHDRLVQTPGVVATEETAIDATLVIEPWLEGHDMDQSIKSSFDALYNLWETPEGIPLEAPVDVWRHARELALGFYYRWVPPPPQEWLEPRKEWSAFVRQKLGRSASLDSPAQVAAMFRDEPVYRAWEEVKDTYEYMTEPVWLDMSVLQAAVDWAHTIEGIVWVEHRAVGLALENLGLPYYGSYGLRNGEAIEDSQGGVAASIAANKEGRNLQRHHRNLVLTPPTTGAAWEQLLGRTHRDGQQADEVTVEVYTGCMESHRALWQAVSDAEYQQAVTGIPQKLLVADITVPKPG